MHGKGKPWSVTKGRGKEDGAGYCGVWMGAGNGEWPKRAAGVKNGEA